MKVKLECTTDYSLFEMNKLNRDLHEDPVLLESMRTHGFMPSSPIHCRHGKNGKWEIIRGHHRFHYAKRLKLPIYFVVDETIVDIGTLERCSRHWTVVDYAVANAKAGNKDYEALLRFQKKHGLTMGAAASLAGGQSAGSGNKKKDIRMGTFKVGDMKHANDVVIVTDLCREQGITFATASAFVNAVSMVLRVPEFDVDKFCHRIKVHPASMIKRSRVDEYLDEIDALYNHGAKNTRMPVKFRAFEISKERQRTFGGHSIKS